MTKKGVSSLEQLIAIEEIKQLKAKYWRSLDQEDWELFSSLFAPDIAVDFREGTPDNKSSDTMLPKQMRGGIIHGKDTWVDVVKHGRAARNKVGSISMHHGHMPEIDILSPTTASGIWALEDMVFWPEGSGTKTMHGFGYYYETYVKIGDVWKIATMRLRRTRVAPITE